MFVSTVVIVTVVVTVIVNSSNSSNHNKHGTRTHSSARAFLQVARPCFMELCVDPKGRRRAALCTRPTRGEGPGRAPAELLSG